MKLDYFVFTGCVEIVFLYILCYEFIVVFTALHVKQNMNIIPSLNLQKYMTIILSFTHLPSEVMGSLLFLVHINSKGLYTPYNYPIVILLPFLWNVTRMARTQDRLPPFPLFTLFPFSQTFVPTQKLRLALPWRLWPIPTPLSGFSLHLFDSIIQHCGN